MTAARPAPRPHATPASVIDQKAAWWRLTVSLVVGIIGNIGIWSVVVVLPTVQAEFGVARGEASLPYTATLLGFAAGGILMGRLADRFGIMVPVVLGAMALGLGYHLAARSTALWQFALAHGLIIGMLGSAATFAPLVADISLWFKRRRGLAVGIVACGNYLAGAVWPPLLQHMVEVIGWRDAYMIIGAVCFVTLVPLAMLLRRPAPIQPLEDRAGGLASGVSMPMSPAMVQGLLVLAGLSCCLAMSMPQVHIVAYCGDLGYGPARGAEMLALMLGFGAVSRVASGWISDRIGGIPALILGSTLQALALVLYIPFDSLNSLYVISILFGLSQGGIVPSYAIIIRELFPAKEAGARIGVVLMSTIVGMAAGGWITGLIFDATGSYQVAFLHGIAWNIVNLAIALWLFSATQRGRGRLATA